MYKIALFLMLGVAFVGCSKSDGKVAVSGTVLVDDKPMEGVSVAFVGSSGGTYDSAITGSEGKFTTRVQPGMNKVAVAKKDTSKVPQPANNDPESQTMGTDAEVAANKKNAPPDLIAPKFSDPEKSGLQFDIKSGSTINISVTSK